MKTKNVIATGVGLGILAWLFSKPAKEVQPLEGLRKAKKRSPGKRKGSKQKSKREAIKILIGSNSNPLSNQLTKLTGDSYNSIDFKEEKISVPGYPKEARAWLLTHRKTGRRFVNIAAALANDREYIKKVKQILLSSTVLNKSKSPKSLGSLLTRFKELEEINDHTGAVKLLVDKYGTKSEKELIQQIYDSHNKNGRISKSEIEQRSKLSKKYYKFISPGLNGLGEYFETHNIKSLDDLKKEYYRLAKKFHPDAGGSTAEFQALGKEYDKLLKKILAGSDLSAEEQANEIELDGHLRKAYEAIMTFPGIVIELAGKWLWVSGQTYPIKEQLKEAEFKFAPKKKMWYYAGVPGGGKGNFSMEEIRGKYGSQKLRTAKEFEMLSGVKGYNKSQFVRSMKEIKKSLHKRKF